MNRQERAQALNLRLEEASAELEADLFAGYTERYLKTLKFYQRFWRYSIPNTMLIRMQRPDATRCAGMKTWNELGYRVKKGEKALWIRGPWIRKEPDPETGELVDHLIGYLALPVWDVSQLDGHPRLPGVVHPLEGDFTEMYERAKADIICAGIIVVEESMPRGLHGLSWGGHISINPELTTSEKLCVLWHELAHEQGHWRDGLELSKQHQELEAQSACWLIGQLHGVDVAWSRDYILRWRGEVHGIHDSFRRIQAIVAKCLATLRFDQRDGEVAP